jgi:hypothetical protein|tara:strand:+ start:185 stop:628 length:444 start_codon:yes stop_codon:yes gene_type:complete
MAEETTTLDAQLDASPVTTVVMDSLHSRFPEGELLNLKEFTDFSNVGEQRPVYLDGKRAYDDNGKPVMEDIFRYSVYDTDGKSTIGQFKFSEPSISWSYIRVQTLHYTNDDGEQYLYFKLMNKLDTIADVQNFVKSKSLLLELADKL